MYAQGLFIVVGHDGTILGSSDAASFGSRTSGTSVALRGFAYGSDVFVAVGNEGVVLESNDGATWSQP